MKSSKQKSLKNFIAQTITTDQQIKIKGGSDGEEDIIIEDVIQE